MGKAYLSLGSNLGNRQEYLAKSRKELAKIGELKKESSVIETKARGKINQPDFLNQVVLLETKLLPQELLKKCQKIETLLGRKRKEKWEARTMDFDILFYDDLVIDEPALKIPHPLIAEREFVLKPLNEIAPELIKK